ncbi:MAG: disulfide bond formation protein B [Candidatus Paceibacterota bacterium]
MTETVTQLNFLLALSTIFMQLGVVVLTYLFFFERDSAFLKLIGKYGIPVAFLLSLGGLLLSLLYSEVFGFVPCGLCWLQRVFLYPQVILFGIALFKKETYIADYVIGLSLVGSVVALYQHYLQMGGTELLGCPVVGAGADCAKRILFEFGYITFPLMSFSVFILTIALMILVKKTTKS